jgi:hypothetical protein
VLRFTLKICGIRVENDNEFRSAEGIMECNCPVSQVCLNCDPCGIGKQPPTISAGYASMVDNADSVAYQLGIMRNVEYEIPKAVRKRLQNWQLVRDYLLQHTSKGGSTSCYHHCRWMGVDPEGYTFR